MDLTDIYTIMHPKVTEYKLSTAQGTFSKTDHISVYKGSFNKHKEIEIASYILSEHNGKNWKSAVRPTTENIQRHRN
jgi:hypothetical protein